MRLARYILVNSSLGMTGGKLGAQVGHACELALLDEDPDSNLRRLYFRGGHYAKLVLDGGDTQTMQNTLKYLEDRGFNMTTIYDEGHTEVAPISFTAMATQVVDRDHAHTAATFSSFSLYKDAPRQVIEFKGRVTQRKLERVREALQATR